MSPSLLRLALSEFADGRFHAAWNATAAELDLARGTEPGRFPAPIRVEVDAKLLPESEVFVTADIAYEVEQDCVRCLEPMCSRRAEKLQMVFYPEAKREEFRAVGDLQMLDDPDVGYHDGKHIDLDEEVTGIILQNLPEYPRHAGDCGPMEEVVQNYMQGGPQAEQTEAETEPEWKKQLRGINLGR